MPRSRSRGLPRHRWPTWQGLVKRLPQWAALVDIGGRGQPARLVLGQNWRETAESLAEAIGRERHHDTADLVQQFERGMSGEIVRRACLGFYPAHAWELRLSADKLAPDARVGDLVPLQLSDVLEIIDHEGWTEPTHANAGKLDWFYALRSYRVRLRLAPRGEFAGAHGLIVVQLPLAVFGAALFDDNVCRPLPPPPAIRRAATRRAWSHAPFWPISMMATQPIPSQMPMLPPRQPASPQLPSVPTPMPSPQLPSGPTPMATPQLPSAPPQSPLGAAKLREGNEGERNGPEADVRRRVAAAAAQLDVLSALLEKAAPRSCERPRFDEFQLRRTPRPPPAPTAAAPVAGARR
jgi:hypothetical protein